MRRTMHAALLTLLFVPCARAQDGGDQLPAPNQVSPSDVGTLSPQAVVDPAPGNMEMAPATGCSRCSGGSGVEFYPTGCNRPYSPLAARMSCNETSPMLWATYPEERAAAIAHAMRHVNQECDCGHHRNLLHRHASGAGCSSGHGCFGKAKHEKAACDTETGCDSVVVNRYHTQPSLPPSELSQKSKGTTLLGIKLPSWGNASSQQDSVRVQPTPASSASAPISPYLKSGAQPPKTAMLSPVATAPGPSILAR